MSDSKGLRMAGHRGFVAGFLAVAIGTALVACSTGGANPIPPAESGDQEVEPVEQPAPEPSPDYAAEVDLTDDEGYTSTFSFELVLADDVSLDIADEPPGFTTVRTRVDASLFVTNTTPGRNYELSGAYFFVALYLPDSPLCAGLDRSSVYFDGREFCGVDLASTVDPIEGAIRFTLGPDQVSADLVYRSGQDVILTGVPEEQAEVIAAALGSPEYFILVSGRVSLLSSNYPFQSYCSLRYPQTLNDGLAVVHSSPAASTCP